MKYDCIVIGAGAAGLMAMKELLEAGYSVCLLEAAASAGGRIATIHDNNFDQPLETGAEFIHGKLPLTLELLHKARIGYTPVQGKMISVQKEQWHENEAHDKNWSQFMQQLAKLKTDMSLAAFLEKIFSADKYTRLRGAVRRYAEGFDLADISKVSAQAMQREWDHEDETYRIPGGYMLLIDFLLQQCAQEKATVRYNSFVESIHYNKNGVTVYVKDDRSFEASAVVVTVSAGMLQAGLPSFSPALNAHGHAIQQLGFGDVIKILLQFKNPFWKMHSPGIGFILSDEPIPTWWTQLPVENNLLTGWLGGPAASAKANDNPELLLHTALESLAAIFHLPVENLQQELVDHKIICWQNYAYIKGGYTYVTVDAANAKKILSHPADEVVFFAGEAMWSGESQGTVEAALQSGREAANMVKDFFRKIFPRTNN